jgi:hypothetical protein
MELSLINKQYKYIINRWNHELDTKLDSENTLVLCFASSDISFAQEPLKLLLDAFPKSKVMGCSTAGEIFDDSLSEERFVVQVIKFEKTELKLVAEKIETLEDSYCIGTVLAARLGKPKAVFVLSDGLNVNGSQLTKGLSSIFKDNVPISGGLAGDDEHFEHTWVIVNNKLEAYYVTALGFYGNEFYSGHGTSGGWTNLGLKRKVTSSKANVLYELDNQPALELYKHYLGERAKGLPSTGLLFPLGIHQKDEIKVRTILSIDEEKQSITFAGDIPKGSMVTLMKSNFTHLINGAVSAAKNIDFGEKSCNNYCCIAISCVGRKLILGQRVEDEIEAVLSFFKDKDVMQIGYYSYGEISPLASGECDLYNQTMTVMCLGEY